MVVTANNQRLNNDLSVLSTTANPISTKDLILRLETIQHQLSSLDQNRVDISTLETITNELISTKLIKHSNIGVQAFVACCLADILRLYAPDAPYDANQLSNIFKLFFNQFKSLSDPENGYYTQNIYLLTRVSEVKLAALLTDLPNSDRLCESIFEIFYNLLASKNFDKSLEYLISDILSEIISECNSLSTKTLKMMLNKFLANTKVLKGQSTAIVPGFDLTLELCTINADRLSRLVTQFFSEIIYESTKRDDNLISDSEDEDENANGGIRKLDLLQLKKIHILAIELWRYVPELLDSVLGLLDNELEADNYQIRIIATSAVGNMLAIQPSSVDFVKAHAETYVNWIKKPLDISAEVRMTWIHSNAKILETRNDISNDLTNGLIKTLIDSDEKVRRATISELSSLKPLTFLKKVANDTIMNTLKQLVREKNLNIRSQSIQFLGSTFNYTIDNCDTDRIKYVNWIPDDILKLVYINDKSINAEVDFVLFEQIIPILPDARERVDRLLTVVFNLSTKAKSSFYAILRRQTQLSQVILQLLSLLEIHQFDMTKTELTSKITKVINVLSSDFPSNFHANECLLSFFKLNNRRYFRLLKLCVSSGTSDYETVIGSMKELLIKLSDSKNIKAGHENRVNTTDMYNTMKLLLLRSAVLFYNKSQITEILNVSKNRNHQFNNTALEILDSISDVNPIVLKANITSLTTEIVNFPENKIFPDRWKDLKAVKNFSSKFPEMFYEKLCKDDNIFFDKLRQFSISGTPQEAKFSIRILAGCKKDIRETYFWNIMDAIWPLDRRNEKFNTHLVTLAELFLHDLLLFETKTNPLSKLLAAEVILKNHTVEEDETRSWISDEDLAFNKSDYECDSKILAMRVLTNWLIAIEDDRPKEIESIAKPVFSMLSSIIRHGGEIVSTDDTPTRYRSRLRLEAGLQLLKIAQHSSYNTFIDQARIDILINLVQDVEENVRVRFIKKLKKRLTQNKISERFIPLIFFVAYEPTPVLKEDTETWIRAAFHRQTANSTRNSLLFEKSYVRLLYMIYKHSELRDIYEEYQKASGSIKQSKLNTVCSFALAYIIFALNLIVTSENISLIFYLSQRVKQFSDANNGLHNISQASMENGDCNERLYFIADLSTMCIKHIANLKSYNLTTWPGTLNLPRDLFTKIPELEAMDIFKNSYIPESSVAEIASLLKEQWRKNRGHNTNSKKIKDFNDHLTDQELLNKKTVAKTKKVAAVERKESKQKSKRKLPAEIPTRRSKRAKKVIYTEEDSN